MCEQITSSIIGLGFLGGGSLFVCWGFLVGFLFLFGGRFWGFFLSGGSQKSRKEGYMDRDYHLPCSSCEIWYLL